jgi:hypothetical protein
MSIKIDPAWKPFMGPRSTRGNLTLDQTMQPSQMGVSPYNNKINMEYREHKNWPPFRTPHGTKGP